MTNNTYTDGETPYRVQPEADAEAVKAIKEDDFTKLISHLSSRFDEVTQHRHMFGQEKYGPVKFLEIDSFEMALEELADLANYVRYSWIKLKLIQLGIRDLLPEDVNEETMGSFKKVGE
jgi:hypothetical protein